MHPGLSATKDKCDWVKEISRSQADFTLNQKMCATTPALTRLAELAHTGFFW